jgi:NAD(P)-dependent dehydrogenase (short-subunit alcohol dehydrogenase family)
LIGSVLTETCAFNICTGVDERYTNESFFSFLRLSARCLSTTMRPEGGSIVLMSSAAAEIGLSNHEAIAAAKGGIEMLVPLCCHNLCL